jgi:hypothetical protein
MKYPQVVTVLALVSACQSPAEQHASPAAPGLDAAPTTAAGPRTEPKAGFSAPETVDGYDTLHATNRCVLRVLPGSEADVAGGRAAPAEADLIRQQAKGRVRREGHALILTPAHGQPVVFTSGTAARNGGEDEATDKSYRYLGSPAGLPYWFVEETLYETQRTLLVHQDSGGQTPIPGHVALSPDRTRLLASYAGMVYEDDASRLQLFALTPAAPRLLWQKTLPDWAPGRTRWLDDHTLAVEQVRLDDSAGVTHSTYVRLRLPQ